MVILIKKKLDNYLGTINRDQSWLARKFGVTKGYISQIANNKCKMPLVMIERLLLLTGMRFEDLFFFDGHFDGREFFGNQIWHGQQMHDNENYKKSLDKNFNW